MPMQLLNQMSADDAVLLLTAGVGLVYLELNRPGRVVPGALGLLATLLALASMGRDGVGVEGILLILAGATVLAADLVRPTPILFAIAATAALCVGLRSATAHGIRTPASWPVAIGCGLLLGAGTSVLTRLARRARVNKRKS
jgi:membrane-bound ClpP family serine protease